MISSVNCGATSYCMCYGVGCSSCIHNPLSNDPNPVNVFLSFKCGSQADLCARCHDFDACYDCDPYDPPCSLFRSSFSFSGGENNG